jgi:hypothetical protein
MKKVLTESEENPRASKVKVVPVRAMKAYERGPKIFWNYFLMVYYVLYYCNSSLVQSTLLVTRYTYTNVFHTVENISRPLQC